MRKKSTRLLSAALAVCMMLSVLPVGAFAAEPGTEPENGNGVSAQAEETLPFAGKEITEGGTYTMEGGEYTGTITVNVQDGQGVIINITGNVTTSINAPLIKVLKGHVTVNGGTATLKNTNVQNGFIWPKALIALSGVDENTTVEINGGTYIKEAGPAAECSFGGVGTLTINSGTFETKTGGAVANNSSLSAEVPAVMQIEGGTFVGQTSESYALQNYGTTIINNGEFKSGYHGIENSGGDLYIHRGTVEGDRYAVYGAFCIKDQTITITGGDFKATGVSATEALYTDGHKLDVTGGTFEIKGKDVRAITTMAPFATIENVTLKVNASEKGVGICARVGSKYPELKNVTFKNNGSTRDYSDLELYNNQDGTYEFNLTEDFASMAVVKALRVSKGLKVTMETNSHYQKDLKLVSADAEYIIDYDHDDDGMEYRYFNTREPGKYYVNPIQATMKAEDGTEMRPYSQFAIDDKVTLTAEEGKKCTGWKVEKIAAEGVTEVHDAGVIWYDSENPETATLTMPGYDVFVTAEYADEVVDPGTGDAAAGNIQGAIAAVVVGAAAGAIIYEAGTGIYRVINMPGIPMPSNRIELAELLWEHAGKPEPVSTALYSDIEQGDTDAQKAAHWAVEQGLMKDDSEKNTFNPYFPVGKLRTCLTWDTAKEKGLFAKTEE
ncbi:MAG: carbohydrate-binding domain-containing protein [Faecalibacterium prausnitzii]|nr:carbohydrate-binding domain-containing protein [Faecalibacterium prausnitzii]